MCFVCRIVDLLDDVFDRPVSLAPGDTETQIWA
jgi:hypothetical protein